MEKTVKNRPALSPRLQLLADLVPAGARVVDVGTDHAFLPVWLLCEKRIPSAIASDLRQGPLQRARQTGRQYGVSGLQYRLCEGLTGIRPEECDTVIIAGMGGEKIAGILQAAPWTRNRTLLLQPMTRAEELRSFLMNSGYVIRQERLVRDRGVLYPVMEAGGGTMQLTPGQLYGGAWSPEDPLADSYLIEKILRYQKAVAGLHRSASPADREKAEQLRDILTALLALREDVRKHQKQQTRPGTAGREASGALEGTSETAALRAALT